MISFLATAFVTYFKLFEISLSYIPLLNISSVILSINILGSFVVNSIGDWLDPKDKVYQQ